jgi:hypothetical protein
LLQIKVEFIPPPMLSLFDSGDKDDEKGGKEEGEGERGPSKHMRIKSSGGGPKQPKSFNVDTITVMFPLPAEDPLIHQRKAAELARALGGCLGWTHTCWWTA